MKDETFLIVTTMKNEAPFMLEWVAYNLSVGFSGILIFTNDCDDGTDRIAMRLEALGHGAHIDNNDRGRAAPQRAALRRALRHPLFRNADWVMCSDADEFLNIRVGGGTLPELVAACGPCDAISVCWKLFGNGGRRQYEDIPVTEQFFGAAPEDRYTNFRGAGLKTLFRNNGAFDRMGVHRPMKRGPKQGADPHLYNSVTWKDAGGRTCDANRIGWKAWGGFSHAFARLHHYAIRSADSFLVKRDRGRTNHVNIDQGREYFDAMNVNVARDYSILPRLPRMLEILQELKADRELRALHKEAVAWHRARIAELTARPDWQDFIRMVHTRGA